MRDLAIRIAPDFRSRAFVVGARIVFVGELVEDDATAILLHLLGQVARIFHAARLRRQQNVGAVGGHALAALHAEIVWHQEQHLVAAQGGGHGQRDARITAGGLDQGIAWLDDAALFSALEHGHGGAVLHGAGRVVAFQLAEDDVVARNRIGARQARQLHQRSIAYRIFKCLVSHRVCLSNFNKDPF